jgi:hypothetical protein
MAFLPLLALRAWQGRRAIAAIRSTPFRFAAKWKVNELLNAFRGAQRLMERGELFTWIKNRVSQHLEVTIEGKPTRSPREIARFLYRIGFIVARSENPDGEYEHYRFDQMPDFLLARTDDDFSVRWEIHPCYRQALDIQKLNQSHRERFGRQRGR